LQLLLQLLPPPLLLLQPQQQPQQPPPNLHQLLLLLLHQDLQQLQQLLLRQQTLLLPLLDPLPSLQHLQHQAALQVLHLLVLRLLHNPTGSQQLSCNRLKCPRSLHQQQLQQHELLPILQDTQPCR
jgi:hypothetical protein